MASFPKTKTTNKEMFDVISSLKKFSNKSGIGTWRAVAAKLAGPASQRSQVNLSRIDKYAKSGESVVVCGKVLGDGNLTKKITIIGFNASSGALEKIEKSGSKFVRISDYISKNPKDKPRIIG